MTTSNAKIVEGRFSVVEPSPILRALARAAVIVGPLMFLAGIAKVFPPGVIGLHLGALGFVIARAIARQNLTGKARQRDVRFTGEGVFVDGALVVKREDIADGLFQPRPPTSGGLLDRRTLGTTVRLFDKRKNILFEQQADEEQALAILTVLGLDASKRRATFVGSSPLFATTARNATFTFGMMAFVGLLTALFNVLGVPAFSFMAMLLFITAVFGGMWPTRIEVGVDGIVERWLWRKRFIPMSQIEQVMVGEGNEVKLRLLSGKVESLYTSMGRARNSAFALQKRDALFARIVEASRIYRSGAPVVDVAALVSRGSRSGGEWFQAVRKLRDAAAHYREAVVRDEDLWSLIENPTAPVDARAGAAIALRGALDEPGRARVRVAAEATASPRLRVVLDAVAGDSDEKVTEAIQELTLEEDRERDRAAGAR